MSSHPVTFADHRDSESGEIIIFVSRDFVRPRDKGVA